MIAMDKIEAAKERFGKLLEEQLLRVEEMKAQGDFVDYKSLDQIIIGVCGGDGIGPAITAQAQRVLEYLLKDEVNNNKVVFKTID
jgi:isocitrate dehydrogenase (NAD+)